MLVAELGLPTQRARGGNLALSQGFSKLMSHPRTFFLSSWFELGFSLTEPHPVKNVARSPAWLSMPFVPALGKHRQEICEFQDSLAI